jgi:hypothetical protein
MPDSPIGAFALAQVRIGCARLLCHVDSFCAPTAIRRRLRRPWSPLGIRLPAR